MNYLFQFFTVSRLFARRVSDAFRSFYWRGELIRRGGRVGKNFRIKQGAEITLERGARIEIGENVYLAERSRIYVGPDAKMFLGSSSFLGVNSLLAARASISAGAGSQIAHNVTIIDHDHDLTGQGGPGAVSPIKIGEGVWVATGSLILKGVQIENGAVVAAGAVVTKAVPAGNIALGREASCRPIHNA